MGNKENKNNKMKSENLNREKKEKKVPFLFNFSQYLWVPMLFVYV